MVGGSPTMSFKKINGETYIIKFKKLGESPSLD
jgi:hypothetical protein